MNFNKIENFKNREIIDNFTSIEEVVNYIKSENREEVGNIRKAREYGKGTEEYDKIKSTLPCVAINFNYSNNYIKGDNVADATGYMYIDIDDASFDIGDMDMTYISAYWKSLSGIGYSIVVKVKNLDVNYLKQQYEYVGSLLDIPFDPNARSIDRLTVLSHDLNAYFNNSSATLTLPTSKIPYHSDIKYNLIGYDCGGEKLRFDNIEELIVNKRIDIVFDESGVFDLLPVLGEKLSYAKCFTPREKIKKGSREKILSSYTGQLIALNKNISKKALQKTVRYVNANKMSPPLSTSEVNIIFNKKYSNRNNLKLDFNKTLRFLYRNYMTTYEKRSATIKKINKGRTERVIERIKAVLLSWNFKEQGKITQSKVKDLSKCAKGTVEKYLNKLLKELDMTKTGRIVSESNS